MESSGKRDSIQVSEETAEVLTSAGLGQWLIPREDSVSVMGKGKMKTFWLLGSKAAGETSSPTSSASSPGEAPAFQNRQIPSDVELEGSSFNERAERRVDWVAEVLLRLLKRIIAKRGVGTGGANLLKRRNKFDESVFTGNEGTVLEEVQEHISLPEYDSSCKLELNADSIELDPEIVRQVRSYVKGIASMYRGNHFHNFEHGMFLSPGLSFLTYLRRMII